MATDYLENSEDARIYWAEGGACSRKPCPAMEILKSSVSGINLTVLSGSGTPPRPCLV